jgi:hypothetical protein
MVPTAYVSEVCLPRHATGSDWVTGAMAWS